MSGTGTVKRIISVMLAAAIIIAAPAALAGCSRAGDPSGPGGTVSDSRAGEVISETDTEITVIDQAGRQVTVSKDPQSIALCYRVVIRFLISLGVGDRITGIGKSEPFLDELQPSLKNCADVGKGVADIEALAELGPDIFIHKASDAETLDAVEKIGIPAVGISVETPEEMMTALDLLGKVCGASEKAAELADHYSKGIAEAEELVSSVTDENRKTAIVMGSSIGKVADGEMLQGKMLETAGAVNCAAELDAPGLWPTAGTEQIFLWNPDYIFITGSEGAEYSADDIYSDPAWAELKAVKDRHVCVIPAERDSWEFPGVVSLLGVYYMIHTMYPDLMSDEALTEKVDDLYALSYGRTFTRKELGY